MSAAMASLSRRVPQLLGAVVEHLGPVDLGLEAAVPKEHRDDLAVADPAQSEMSRWTGAVATVGRPFGDCPAKDIAQ